MSSAIIQDNFDDCPNYFYYFFFDILPQTLQVNAQLVVICFHVQTSMLLARYSLTKY